MQTKRDARRGDAPIAAGAMNWGQPVLDSSITEIRDDAPYYRGRSSVDLVELGHSFESVAELLWTGILPKVSPVWTENPESVAGLGQLGKRFAKLLRSAEHPLDVLMAIVPTLALGDDRRLARTETTELSIARSLIPQMAAALALPSSRRLAAEALEKTTIAKSLLTVWGLTPNRRRSRAVDRALVLVADHELNVSTFAARIAASADADLYACISSALGAFSGPRHGEACDQIEALVDQIGSAELAPSTVRDRLRRGEGIPGLGGHPLYPSGDPRGTALLEWAEAQPDRPARYQTLIALLDATALVDPTPPSLDCGLVALCFSLGLPRGAPSALFAIGRVAGWVAHVREQREARALLRPRARFVQ
jgi:citrate synthase